MKALVYSLIVFALIVCSCEKIELNDSFICHIGKNYKVTDDLSFRINSINDSRCPQDVVCVWQGTVTIKIEIKEAQNTIDTILYLNESSRVGGYKYSIIDVKPQTTGNSTSNDIKIKMLITEAY